MPARAAAHVGQSGPDRDLQSHGSTQPISSSRCSARGRIDRQRGLDGAPPNKIRSILVGSGFAGLTWITSDPFSGNRAMRVSDALNMPLR